jgi:hypothetical protein
MKLEDFKQITPEMTPIFIETAKKIIEYGSCKSTYINCCECFSSYRFNDEATCDSSNAEKLGITWDENVVRISEEFLKIYDKPNDKYSLCLLDINLISDDLNKIKLVAQRKALEKELYPAIKSIYEKLNLKWEI